MAKPTGMPTKEQLWEAAQTISDLNRYVQFMMEYDNHGVVMMIMQQTDTVIILAQRAIKENRVTVDDIASLKSEEVNITLYLLMREFFPHDDAISVIKSSRWPDKYVGLRQRGLTHEEATQTLSTMEDLTADEELTQNGPTTD